MGFGVGRTLTYLEKSCLAICLSLDVVWYDKDKGNSNLDWRILEIFHFSGSYFQLQLF